MSCQPVQIRKFVFAVCCGGRRFSQRGYRRAFCYVSEQYCYVAVQNVNWQTVAAASQLTRRSPLRGARSQQAQAVEPSADDLILLRVSTSSLRCSRLRPAAILFSWARLIRLSSRISTLPFSVRNRALAR